MKVEFKQVIKTVMEGVFEKIRAEADKFLCELREKRKVYEEWPGKRALLILPWNRAELDSRPGKNEYVGKYNDCSFTILYEVFGVGIIGFLFNQARVPNATISPILPEHFLSRLATLEVAARQLIPGQRIPVLLPQTAPYMPSGPEAAMKSFTEEHRFFLAQSLRELREFGELGRIIQQMEKDLEVYIKISIPEGEHSDEIMASAHEERADEDEPSAKV